MDSSSPIRPQNIDYSSVVDSVNQHQNGQTKVPKAPKAPPSPKYMPSSPYYPESPYYTPLSPSYNPESPHLSISNAKPPTYSPSSQIHSPNSTGTHEKPSSIVTDTIHIPGWATGFVLGGRKNKRLLDIIERYGNIVEMVGPVVRFKHPFSGVYQIVTLVACGTKSDAINAMRDVKNALISTIIKARRMKEWRIS